MELEKDQRTTLRNLTVTQKRRLSKLVKQNHSSMNAEILKAIDHYLLVYNPTKKQKTETQLSLQNHDKYYQIPSE